MVKYTLRFCTPGVSESDTFYGLIHNDFIPLQRKLQKEKESYPNEFDLPHKEPAKVAELQLKLTGNRNFKDQKLLSQESMSVSAMKNRC